VLDLMLPGGRKPLELLCIGAHCDDIEIGCGATLLRLAGERPVSVTWVILASTRAREAEARRSAAAFLRAARRSDLRCAGFRDGFLPAQWAEAKEFFETLKNLPRPDLVFTHERGDLHQDHRVANELTWNTFRDHLILEFEIPKFDGGLSQIDVVAEAHARPYGDGHEMRDQQYLVHIAPFPRQPALAGRPYSSSTISSLRPARKAPISSRNSPWTPPVSSAAAISSLARSQSAGLIPVPWASAMSRPV